MKKLILLLLLVAYKAPAQVTRNYNVVLRGNASVTPQMSQTLWDGEILHVWGITGSLSAQVTVPGRMIYANEGDTVILNTRNVAQGQHHTIHLHGLDVDTRNDGVPMTSFALNHMQDTIYTFYASHAGTYLYHCHVASPVHVQMGMYAMIVIKAAGGTKNAWTGGPAFDKDYKWLMSEVDKSWHDTTPPHDSLGHVSFVPKYYPDYFWVNGKSKQQIKADDSTKVTGAVGEKIYMRLANMGYYTNQVVFPSSLNATIIDSDGRPLPTAIVSDTVTIFSGERYGVMLTPAAQIIDSVIVNYINMNTALIGGTEYVPVTINGFIGVDEELNLTDIVVYPNPSSSIINVQLKNHKIKSFQLLNNLGQKIFVDTNNYQINNNALELNVSGISNGVYFLTIENDLSFKTTKKISVHKN